jgi:GntR family transcriptional regulator/MocR family aminotransferase
MAILVKSMVPFIPLNLDRGARIPLHKQLYEEIRGAILSGRLGRGARLPATRALAADLGISRNTVAGAFDQLLGEGYLQGKVGSGTYVTATLPEELLRVRRNVAGDAQPQRAVGRLSERGRRLASIPVSGFQSGISAPRAFRAGLPALDQFPRRLWSRMAARLWRHVPAPILTYADAAGYRPLREAIAGYVGASRGVRCSADQVLVTAGSQQALDLAGRLLLDPGETAWVEDPGYLGGRGALQAAGIHCAPVPVDAEGLDVEAGMARAPEGRLAVVTPSHQYPLGITMSLARRMQLLAWARQQRAWIIEDDYDSEYRYAGRPLAALQGLDPAGRVIYAGTFSKVLFPALRLGYLIVPESMVDAFVAARALADRHSPGIDQVLVAEFLAEGHFARHVRRMRALYAERQHALVSAAERELTGLIEVRPSQAGLDLIGWLPKGIDDRRVAAKAAAAGVMTAPVSAYVIEARLRPGLRLGYAALSTRQIREGVRKLAAVLNAS